MPGIFKNENLASGLSQTAPFQVGISDVDSGQQPEIGLVTPWLVDPVVSWLDYQCWIVCKLDAGIVVHRALPQGRQAWDTLAQAAVDDAGFAEITKGVNTKSNGKFLDIVQRMAHSTYWFCLMGWARRAGYQIPIPSLKTVAGVQAIPDDEIPQEAFNRIVGNMSGIPLWFARWQLWYTVSVPPKAAQDPPAELSSHITAKTPLPTGVQVPVSVPDQESVRAMPRRSSQPLRRSNNL